MAVSNQNDVGYSETEREQIPVKNPVTGEIIGQIPVHTRQDVEDAVERARFAQKTWSALSVQTRAAMMRRWADMVWEQQNDVVRTIRRETGKTDGMAFSEIIVLDVAINYYYHNAARLLKPQTRNSLIPFVHKARVHYHPYGVVGVISPWNFPFHLPFADLIPALIAGNTVVFKPSEITPYSAELGVELLYKAGVPRDVVQIVHGGGSTGSALVDAVDYIAFTGSTATGRKIAARAGERLIPCSMELGGKHPAVVLNDAEIENAASGLIKGAFSNAGQFCMGIERAYVDDEIHDRLVARVQHYMSQYVYGAGDGPLVHMGSLTNEREIERIEAHIQDAVSKGATLIHGGKRRPDLGPLFFEPTVLTNVDHSMKVMQEETFAPMLPIMKVKGMEEAIRLANDSEYGLAASVWTKDLTKGELVATRLMYGDVTVNVSQMVIGTPTLPSGGRRASGIGRRNGPEGLMRYVASQSVVLNNGLAQEPTLSVLDDKTLMTVKILRAIRRYIPFI
jgi:succinate-semialdehyde dehydrogenase / glutarate-semialdehyde dehydrogenase